ncbi:phospholipase B1, membrane-associated-like, partial [Carassius auratus]|uniref:Phospholipase B1, membrane-associated-like n=1 Tax=Carassius auratus TaxID=7957 RepID=A0A6P6MS84_CARAU
MNQKQMILSIMGIKDHTFSSCAQIMILALLACRCSAVESLRCAVSSPSPSTPVSVHSLRPADVSMVSALVLSDVKRSDEIRALNMLSEILFTFNPDVTTVVPDQRSLMDHVKYMESLSSPTQWKLLLFFIPVDELSVCTDQDLNATIDATVNKVEQTLDSLHKKLKNTLVMLLFGVDFHMTGQVCQFQCEERYDENRRRLDTIVLMALLQESVSALLERRGWFGDREDFSVMLQSSPVHIELSNP